MIVIAIPDTCLTILINQLPAQLMSNNNDDYYHTCSYDVTVGHVGHDNRACQFGQKWVYN